MSTRIPLVLVSLLAFGCGGGDASTGSSATTSAGGDADSIEANIEQGIAFVRDGRCAEAIREGFEPAVVAMERELPEPRRADRGLEASMEAVQGLMAGSGLTMRSDLVPTIYPDALYMIAFCHIELEDLGSAERYLTRALAVIPDDVMYLSELGHIYQMRGDFQKALDDYQRAVASVVALRATAAGDTLSIMGLDLRAWHRRALRGVGFSLIELGRLDEAETTYREVLAIDPSDEQARTELAVIAERRGQR